MSAHAMTTRQQLRDARCLVVKVGSSLLADLDGGVNAALIERLAGELSAIRAGGTAVVLVSSGAVAAGTVELGLGERPSSLPMIQAAAAVGQCALMRLYREAFAAHGVMVGQVLLTRDGLHDRQRWLHAQNTMRALLDLGVVPVVNENDTVAVEELKLKMGDNDRLAVNVTQLTDADCLIILTDVPGLYTCSPADDGAELINHVEAVTDALAASAGGTGSAVGSGGMASKVKAARAVGMAAVPLVVADGKREMVLSDILAGKDVGTFFAPRAKRTSSRLQWIAFGRATEGALVVDDGAVRALVEQKKSLLAIGVKEVRGTFAEADTVSILAPDGREVGRGLVNFNAEEARKIAGQRSDAFANLLGYETCDTVVHRDHLVIL